MIAVLTATVLEPPPDCFLTSCGMVSVPWDAYLNKPNIGVVQAYQKLWEKHQDESALIYMHDDVTIKDANWLERVCLELMDPKVAIVGMGGAGGIGVEDIYKVPYAIEQLIRVGYASNQVGWEIHGDNEKEERRVAVVDGFFMAIKGAFLKEIGGWSWMQSNFHCYDTAMCLEAYRRGWEVRIAGVKCEHHGGGTSTKAEYIEFCKERGTTVEEDHQLPHRWLYDRYRDLLPFRVQP
jgi:GT2 family glycosyltransferase